MTTHGRIRCSHSLVVRSRRTRRGGSPRRWLPDGVRSVSGSASARSHWQSNENRTRCSGRALDPKPALQFNTRARARDRDRLRPEAGARRSEVGVLSLVTKFHLVMPLVTKLCFACHDRTMALQPHRYFAADWRTRSFQSVSSGSNGPARRSTRTRSNSLAAQSDSIRASKYSSFECGPNCRHFVLNQVAVPRSCPAASPLQPLRSSRHASAT